MRIAALAWSCAVLLAGCDPESPAFRPGDFFDPNAPGLWDTTVTEATRMRAVLLAAGDTSRELAAWERPASGAPLRPHRLRDRRAGEFRMEAYRGSIRCCVKRWSPREETWESLGNRCAELAGLEVPLVHKVAAEPETVSIGDEFLLTADILGGGGVVVSRLFLSGDPFPDLPAVVTDLNAGDPFPTGGRLNEAKAKLRIAAPGKHIVSVQPSQFGRTGPMAGALVVVLLDPPVVDAGEYPEAIAGTKIQLKAGISQRFGSVVKRQWFDPEGKEIGTDSVAEIEPTGTGRFPYLHRAVDDDGNVGQDTAWIEVIPDPEQARPGQPYAYADVQTRVPPSEAKSLRAVRNQGRGASWEWKAKGSYRVLFPGMILHDTAQEGMVSVTAISDKPVRCLPTAWSAHAPAAGDVEASIQCLDFAGDPQDADFSVLWMGPDTVAPRLAYAVSPAPTFPDGPQADRLGRNPAGDVSLFRGWFGQYSAIFRGLYAERASPGMALVQSLSATGAWCSLDGLKPEGPDVKCSIQCRAGAGGNVDARFAVLSLPPADSAFRYGYAIAPGPGMPGDPAPETAFSYNTGGKAQVSPLGAGRYTVAFPGLGAPRRPGNIQVTPYGPDVRATCVVEGWIATPEIRATVACFDPDGKPAEARFSILAVE